MSGLIREVIVRTNGEQARATVTTYRRMTRADADHLNTSVLPAGAAIRRRGGAWFLVGDGIWAPLRMAQPATVTATSHKANGQ